MSESRSTCQSVRPSHAIPSAKLPGVLSWTIPDDYEGVDHIPRISPVQVMVIHSVRDGIIPFHHGEALFEAAQEPKEFLQTDTPHGATFVIPGYRREVLRFMNAGR